MATKGAIAQGDSASDLQDSIPLQSPAPLMPSILKDLHSDCKLQLHTPPPPAVCRTQSFMFQDRMNPSLPFGL